MKGLHCSIYRAAGYPDTTAGGATSTPENITLIGDGIEGPFEPTEDAPALWLEYDLDPKGARAGQLTVASVDWIRKLRGEGGCSTFECMGEDWSSKHQIVRVVARPIGVDGKPRLGGMFGGNYIKTSDSRFPVQAPIPVHDRFEY